MHLQNKSYKKVVAEVLSGRQLTRLPEYVCDRSDLEFLFLSYNQLTNLPESIGKLTQLTVLTLQNNQLTSLPESIGNLTQLTELTLQNNQLTSLPKSIGNLTQLTELTLQNNQLTSLPESIGNLTQLTELDLDSNRLTKLPNSLGNLTNLTNLSLDGNPLLDLSILQQLSNLKIVRFCNLYLPRRYWTNLREWKALPNPIPYLSRINLTEDTWREYTLISVNYEGDQTISEPMTLSKMICPSTHHTHFIRVPPSMTNAEAAITWVNHGIHPDEFMEQT